MFVGRPPGNYDRLLDFSHAVTGTLFFAPTATFLENVTTGAPAAAADSSSAPEAPTSRPSGRDGSLGIGTLKGKPRHE